MGRIHALFVVTGLNVGGIESYVLNVLRTYDRSKLKIDVCYVGAEPGLRADEVLRAGSRLLACRYGYAFPLQVARMTALVRRYDAVCDFAGDIAATAMLAGKLGGVPVRIAFYRSSGVGYRPTRLRRTAARALRLIVEGCATQILGNSKTNLRTFFPKRPIDGKCFAVVYNGIARDRFSPDRRSALRAKARLRWNLPENTWVLGHVGSFTPPKAHDVLVEAYARLSCADDTRLLLVGDGPLRPMIEERVRRLGIADRVVFAGIELDVAVPLAAMDGFAFPSRYEGFPNALLEAQAMGLPIVVSERPEIREAILDTQARAVPVGDADALAEAIMELRADPGAVERARINAEVVRNRFAIEHSVDQLSTRLGAL